MKLVLSAIIALVLGTAVSSTSANAELDRPLGQLGGRGNAALQRHGAAHCIDGAGELDQDAVAGGLDDPAAMLGNVRID